MIKVLYKPNKSLNKGNYYKLIEGVTYNILVSFKNIVWAKKAIEVVFNSYMILDKYFIHNR